MALRELKLESAMAMETGAVVGNTTINYKAAAAVANRGGGSVLQWWCVAVVCGGGGGEAVA
jgi:hypothetical protein